MVLTPFAVAVPEAALDDLRDRLGRTRWPDEVRDAGWDYGADLFYMRDLCGYWRDGFDWRAQERTLNGFAQFRTQLDGLGIHFVHERGTGPRPMPLLITHGWPSSFVEMLKLVPLLTDPGRHGADPSESFDVVVPSVPGFGFSDWIQETRPQTLAYGLNDSPAALAAWIVEKWRSWTSPRGDVSRHFSRDELLTNVTVYWVTQTGGSSTRSYYERARDPRQVGESERIRVPTGVALTTEAVQRAPREWVERRYTDIRHWTEFPRGGHFLALEEPELLVRISVRSFARSGRVRPALRGAAGYQAV